MKKARQIFALVGIIILVLMYLITLFAAIFDSTSTMIYFRASVIITIVIPILLWVMGIFLKLADKKKDPFSDMDAEDSKED